MKNLAYLLLFVCNISLSQSKLDKDKISCDSIQYFVFDYFRQVKDYSVYDIGKVTLMNYEDFNDSLNEYCVFKNQNLLVIKFKDEILYEYQISKGKVNGLGFVYYPFLDKTALIGEFKNDKLHGSLYVFDKKGILIEVLKYKRGKYIKHQYFWLDSNTEVKSRKKIFNKTNPLNNYDIIR